MFTYDFPYPSRRMPVLARNVATSQPLAAQAGLQALHAGGNAVDAALAAAITLTVVEPTSNGIGSDAFAIGWDGRALHGLNGSGRSPAAWTPERFAGRDAMPDRGRDAVTVPGAVSTWVALSQRFGALPFAQLFEPAVSYADDGFLVPPVTARVGGGGDVRGHAGLRARLPAGRARATPGRAVPVPRPGGDPAPHRRDGGRGLLPRRPGRTDRRARRAIGGLLTGADLDAHRADWVQTITQG